MSFKGPNGSELPTLFCLHFLGGSAKQWRRMEALLPQSWRCVAIDLPGFGDASAMDGYGVSSMADRVAAQIAATASPRWVLVGHSMGAKVATVLARRAEDGEPGLQGLSALVLLAGSPPGPEPMAEAQREAMLTWFSSGPEQDRIEAEHYIEQNVGAPLDPAMREQAVAEVLRASPEAWRAWLRDGSREDWSARVGVLRTPTLIIAGECDAALGPDGQRAQASPHFAHVRLLTLPGAGHLLPMERPEQIARLIAEHAETHAPTIGASYLALIHSERVSAKTRSVLLARGQADEPGYQPGALGEDDFTTLRAVVKRVLPQPLSARIAIAARIDSVLQAANGDGWRFALLPGDRDAYRAALRTLEQRARARYQRSFCMLDDAAQDAMLGDVAGGKAATSEAPLLDARQMQLWFEDLRADAVKIYVSHPATLERIGYGGFAYGGDTPRKSGFQHFGAGDREAWEPRPSGATRTGDKPAGAKPTGAKPTGAKP